ncbi:hypothetical protein H0H81_000086 [Sphagnurus paluster]|uniref:N-acetyltransferase domain-containing protein n=1 Tax=Sphagnurus paluster TaxID=117069 RepID=A0A9P7GQX9_9AGAR|nr:hypothetical protein H0H81_000086 [Sphagnurus paluster]
MDISNSNDVYLSNKLVGQDDHITQLIDLFEQLQLATVETCHPNLDIFTFSEKDEDTASPQDTMDSPWSSYSSDSGQCEIWYEQKQEIAIGLVYLASPGISEEDPLHCRELSIGIIIDRAHRGRGHARYAMNTVLDKAFREYGCHRILAMLPEHIANDKAICFFTQMRFEHEGTRRRGFFSRMENTFKDVTYMGMLNTDWMLNAQSTSVSKKVAPKSVWDELFARHQREREELLCWETTGQRRGRRVYTPTQIDYDMGEDEEGADIDVETDTERMGSGSSSEGVTHGMRKLRVDVALNQDVRSPCPSNPSSGYLSASSSVVSFASSGYALIDAQDFSDEGSECSAHL